MSSLITIIPVAAGAYIATNLDNLMLLVALLARYRIHTSQVVAAYVACMLILGVVGFGIGMAANFAPVRYLGLLGIVPIFIGVFELVRLHRGNKKIAGATEESVGGAQKAFLTTLLSQLSNGADTVLIFGILGHKANKTPISKARPVSGEGLLG